MQVLNIDACTESAIRSHYYSIIFFLSYLSNIVFASPSKSRIRNLQSIGRVLRRGKNKTKATLYDIADDLTKGSKKNYTLNHFIERVKIYVQEQFNYEIISINIKE